MVVLQTYAYAHWLHALIFMIPESNKRFRDHNCKQSEVRRISAEDENWKAARLEAGDW